MYSLYVKFLQEYEVLGNDIKILMQCTPIFIIFLLCSADSRYSLLMNTRVVFDTSANTISGNSLNDALMNGGDVQDNLVSILLRFRMYKFVMTTDIEKIYRQTLIYSEHKKHQRILLNEI